MSLEQRMAYSSSFACVHESTKAIPIKKKQAGVLAAVVLSKKDLSKRSNLVLVERFLVELSRSGGLHIIPPHPRQHRRRLLEYKFVFKGSSEGTLNRVLLELSLDDKPDFEREDKRNRVSEPQKIDVGSFSFSIKAPRERIQKLLRHLQDARHPTAGEFLKHLS